MAQRHDRSAARRAALQVLYSAEITETPATQIIKTGIAPDESGALSAYAVGLVEGVEAHVAEIDSLLNEASENWAIGRMPVVDRALLRIAVYEMAHVDAVPVSVAINEAVELAKDFGAEDDSHRFVNGVLGNIAKKLTGESYSALGDE